MDIWDKEKRSAVMAKIKSKDTKPELIVRHYLYHRGYRYRKNVKGLPGTPDIVLGKYRVVIFVHGCFWHGHIAGECYRAPKSNVEFWATKIQKNRERDVRNYDALKSQGWNVLVVWECQLSKKKRQETLRALSIRLSEILLELNGVRRYLIDCNNDNEMLAAEPVEDYKNK